MQLENFPAFAGLNKTQVENFTAAMQPAEAAVGTELITQAERSEKVYFLVEGKLRVHLGEQELAVISAPCIVGELEMLTGGKSIAGVTVVEACKGMSISCAAFAARLADGDASALKVVLKIAKLLGQRLTAMDEKVAEILAANHTGNMRDLQTLRAKLFGEWST